MGQPALSIQLKQFEEAIGKKLFERAHRKMTLSENGKIALEYAKEIFKSGTEMIETLHDRPSANRIHLQIGTLDSIPKSLTLQVAKEVIKNKNCSITFLEGRQDELLRELTQHRIDLLITNQSPLTGTGQVYTRKIARLELFAIGSKKFQPLKKNFPESLRGKPLIASTADNRIQQDIDHFLKLKGIQPDIISETQDLMLQKLMAIEEIGVIIAPEFAVREYLKKKELYILGKLDNVFEELFLVAASRKIENPIAAELIQKFEIKL
jgi:LysR family transcriptional activator of nhaA